jgi:hypothetical protein
MFHKKLNLILTALIILLLNFASIAQAAPPLQEGSQDGTSTGDSLNLDDDGNVIEDETEGGNNLGTIMSDKGEAEDDDGADDTGDDATDDDTGDETGDDDDATDDDGADDDGNETDDGDDADDDGDEADDDGDADDDTDDGDDTAGDETTKQHPVASAIAEYFEVTYEEVKALHESGYGFGNIAKAYFFAEQLGLTPDELLLQAHESGWGNVLKENGIHPGSVGKGNGNHPDEVGPPEHAGKPDKADHIGGPANNHDISELAGPGGGKGNGNGNGGNGQGQDDDHGGKDKDKGNNGHGKGKGKNK